MKSLFFTSTFLLLIWSHLSAQNLQISGKILDEKKEAIIGVNITVSDSASSPKILAYATSDIEGQFILKNLLPQKYILKISFVGYQDFIKNIDLNLAKDFSLDTIQLSQNATELNEVLVKAKMATAIQKGDTLQFNAAAFKVNKDAAAGDLMSKIPGVTNENGVLKAQGENVREILVDGKAFFGDDAAIALKNLPAEIIDKIEIFDKRSEQSQLTGFNDGNTSKTINIVTRPDRRNGKFGRASAGYGTDETYSANFNYNQFKGNRRFSLLGMSNNVNQLNFTNQDLFSVNTGANSQRGRGNNTNANRNTTFGPTNGINITNALGFNYNDNWGKKITVRSSYFFNKTNTETYRTSQRQYFLTNGNTQFYKDTTLGQGINYNHRINMRLEYTIDSANSIVFTPQVSWQVNQPSSQSQSQNVLSDILLNKAQSRSVSDNDVVNFNGDLLFRHKFSKRGRSISLTTTLDLNNRDGLSSLNTQNIFFGIRPSTQTVNQRTNSFTDSYRLTGNLAFTEPLSKNSILQLTYNVSYNNNVSSRIVNRFNINSEIYDRLDSLLSNKFDNNYVTQRVGAGYNFYKTKKFRLSSTVALQVADLEGNQLFPKTNTVGRSFTNLLPTLLFEYQINGEKKLRFNYNTSTQAPSITQLQNVINNSNPLLISTGNPNLDQEYGHSLSTRYTVTNPTKASSFVALLSADYTLHPIGNSIFIADQPTTVEGFFLGKGAQLIRPVNLENAYNIRGFVTLGIPFKPLKSNFNLNTNLGYVASPGLINNVVNYSYNSTISQGIVVGSNVSENVDFTLSYTFNFNNVENSLRPQLNNKYYNQTASVRGNFTLGKGMVIQTDLTHQQYTGLADSFNQQFTLWNMAFAKKILKKQAGELKLTVFDLLKQNTSIARNITATYLEDVNSLVLQQYFMLSFTYTLRAFGMGGQPQRTPRNNSEDGNDRPRFRENGGGGFRNNN
ncbi:MAG: outer membrane beta-barrel protein [Arcicella sp.]|nr:outer membrane beta-barrel protein [Arcicella sp.]